MFNRSSKNSNPSDIPTFAPAACKIRPDNPTTLTVTDKDMARWQSKPDELVGKGFITSGNIMRRTFFIQDYYVKLRGGPQYDVVFEDTGLDDLNVLDPETVLTMVKDAKLIDM